LCSLIAPQFGVQLAMPGEGGSTAVHDRHLRANRLMFFCDNILMTRRPLGVETPAACAAGDTPCGRSSPPAPTGLSSCPACVLAAPATSWASGIARNIKAGGLAEGPLQVGVADLLTAPSPSSCPLTHARSGPSERREEVADFGKTLGLVDLIEHDRLRILPMRDGAQEGERHRIVDFRGFCTTRSMSSICSSKWSINFKSARMLS